MAVESPRLKSRSVYDVHRATAMLMLTSPSIPKGANHCPAIWPIDVATTVKVASARVMAESFQSLMRFDPRTVDDISGLHKIYRRIGSEPETYLDWGMTIAEGVRSDTHWSISTSDGMRAINIALETLLSPGDGIVVSKPLYGCTDGYFSGPAQRRGYDVRIVDLTAPEAILEVLNPKTKVVYFETLTNPDLRTYDLETISRLAKGQNPNIVIVVDNTFQSPAGCNPLLHGADISVHSATKALGGFSQEMMGFIVAPKSLWAELFMHRKDSGGVPAPQQVHEILTRGLPTLYMRFAAAQNNATVMAQHLQDSSKMRRTVYPGLPGYQYSDNARRLFADWDGNFAPGFMLSFVPEGKTEQIRTARAKRIIDYIARFGGGIIKHAVSLGGISSLIEMPYLGTHATVPAEEKARWGIDSGMIRLSVGIAPVGDQISLLDDAIRVAFNKP